MHRFLFLVLALVLPLSAFSKEGGDRPNILWITSEDNSASWLGCYGNEQATTPNIDALAEQGFRYNHCYANAPVCAPSRNTWITGVMALSMGTHPMRSTYPIPHEKIKLYPDYLNETGYTTGNFKKTDYNFGGRKPDECWDSSKAPDWKMLQQSQPFFQVVNFTQSHESRAFGEVDNTTHDPEKVKLAVYHPDVPDMRKNYAKYHDAVQTMDSLVGDTLKKLDDLGLTDNTIVIYNSDHGGVLPRSKRFLFQNSLHCPLVIRIPEKFKHLWPVDQPGSEVDRLVSFVDMPKTWLSITGAEVPEVMQGKVFLGLQSEPEQSFHFAFRGRMDERLDNARAVLDKQYLYIRNYMPYVPWLQRLDYLWRMKATLAWEQAIRDGNANEVQSRFFQAKGWTEELYDMTRDPDNVNNLAESPEHGVVLEKMRKDLRNQQEAIYDSGLLPESECVRLAEKHGMTIYEMVRDPKIYNVPALLDAADLALAKDAGDLPELRELLDHDEIGMRYWGIVGCFLQDDPEAGLKVINDESHEVRAMAAWLLIRTGEKYKGLACLQTMLEEHSYALLTLLNMAIWIGDDAQALLPVIRGLDFEEAWAKRHKYEVRMREHVLNRFGGQSWIN